MNVWNFTGNIGKDAEVGSTQGGKPFCKFSVAVSSGYGDNKKTSWANCVIFGKQAEGGLPQYLLKGQQVAVSGELTLEEWESNGVKNKALKVVVGNIDLVGAKPEPSQSGGFPQKPAQPQRGSYQQPQHQAASFDDFDQAIPF